MICGLACAESLTQRSVAAAPQYMRDVVWVWGNPEMAKAGPPSLDRFAEASPAERARLLGAPNVVLAGLGLPGDDEQAEQLARDVSHAPKLVWEIAPDVDRGAAAFEYDQSIARARRLAASHAAIEGVLLDDMTSVAIDRGLKPGHIRRARELLGDGPSRLKLWGVVYTMNLDRENIDDYVAELDVINLWTWHARDIPQIGRHVEEIRRRFPHKPIMLGLYLYDYGAGRPMPLDLLSEQCRTARELVSARQIDGIVFLTIDNDSAAVGWTADWVARFGNEPLAEPSATPRTDPLPLTLNDSARWSFLGGEWSQDDQGVIRPPDVRNLHSRAFRIDHALSDLTAEFEFSGDYRETGTGSAGLVLRAQDAHHFYLIYFPWGGQQLRAKHFWAVVAKVDGDGYIRHLAASWVPGVPSETDRWYRVKVEARGERIRVWVDDRFAVEATDNSYTSGRAGLCGYGWYKFRNVVVQGIEVEAEAWQDDRPIPRHAYPVGLSSEQMPSGCVSPEGDVILAAGDLLARSHDHGQTWEAPERLPASLGTVTDYGNALFASADRLHVMVYSPPEQVGGGDHVPRILMAESSDNGVTWSEPVESVVDPGWPAQPKQVVPYGPVVQTADGAWLRFLLGGVKLEGDPYPDVRTWGSIHAKAYVIRGTDQGRRWSSPIELDRPSWVGSPRGTIPGSLDFTEPTAVVLGERVTALIRPVYSPYMWQCWSQDGGRTWDAAVRSTFPGYAQSMVRTRSGAILCAHRYPHYCVNISRDGGMHWDAGTVIDYPVWAMGCLMEVEPDVVLAAYMNAERSQPLLVQRIAVTPAGIRPVSLAPPVR